MTRTLHDIRCISCGREEHDVVIVDHEYPACENCGDQTEWIPAKLTTDLFGTPQYSDATGEFHSSQREKERHMARLGFHGKGDKEHGARPDLSIKRTGFSYSGQHSHVSTGERGGAK
jgi:hypothetical protein